MTWSPFSDITHYARPYNMPDSNSHLEEIRKVMDFQHLFIRNSEYTTMIRNIDISMSEIFYIITHVLQEYINNLNNKLDFTYTNNSTSDCLNTLDRKYKELVEYFNTCYFLKKDGYHPNYIIDDFGARLAHDVLRDWGHMDPFIQTINDSLAELYELVQKNVTDYLQNNTNNNSDWIIYYNDVADILKGICVKINKCLSSLGYIHTVHRTLYNKVRGDKLFAINAKWKGDIIDHDYVR